MAYVLGIDLGTTNSVGAVFEGGAPLVLQSKEGPRTVPSVVLYSEDGRIVVGETAKNQKAMSPDRTIYSAKRLMGETMTDVGKQHIGPFPFALAAGPNDRAEIAIPGRSQNVTPPEVGAQVLRKIKEDAEAQLGEPITEAVITVPAYFNNDQREATKEAGKIAGLNVLRIINEPTAAALAYGVDKQNDENILVFDLGGGTFDVSVLNIASGVIEVYSTAGDTKLGGDDYDLRIVDWVSEKFKQQTQSLGGGVDLRSDPASLMRVVEAAEKAKIALSSSTSTSIALPFISFNPQTGQPLNFNQTLTRAEFESMTRDLTERCSQPIQDALRQAGPDGKDDRVPADKKRPASIDQVLLVGGSTRMPAVQAMVAAALPGVKINKGVDPDQVVAQGAAVQGAILTRELKDVILVDVTPLSLGIQTKGGVNTVLIPRNTAVPATARDPETDGPYVFSTADDNQDTVEVIVLQGERKMAAECKTLGTIVIEGIRPAKAGVPEIEVQFNLDANGTLTVLARDLAFPDVPAQELVLTGSTSLSKDEVDRMVSDAAANAERDRAFADAIETRNKAEVLLQATTDALTKWKFDEGDPDRAALDQQTTELRGALQTQDDTRIARGYNDLQQTVDTVVSKMQARARAAHSAETAAPEGPAAAEPVETPDAQPAPGPVVDRDPFGGLD